MARGRMLNKTVSLSDKFNNLPDDTSRLLATWLLAHLDFRGVFYADAIRVRTQVFSMREDLTTLRVKHCLEAIEAVGLFKTFKARNQVWMFWPGFEHNQINLRKDRESSPYPPPPADYVPEDSDEFPPEPEDPCDDYPEDIRQTSGNVPEGIPPKMPEDVPQNIREVNIREGNAASAAGPLPSDHNTSVSDATKPEAEDPHSSTVTPPAVPKADKTRERDVFFDRLAEITKANPKLQGGVIARTKKQLLSVNADLPSLNKFVGYWRAEDWRGKKNQPPTLAQVVSEWGKAMAWNPKGGADQTPRRTVKEVINGVEVERIVYEQVVA